MPEENRYWRFSREDLSSQVAARLMADEVKMAALERLMAETEREIAAANLPDFPPWRVPLSWYNDDSG